MVRLLTIVGYTQHVEVLLANVGYTQHADYPGIHSMSHHVVLTDVKDRERYGFNGLKWRITDQCRKINLDSAVFFEQ